MGSSSLHRLAAIDGEAFDVAIVGGGIIGCGVARDAARRGLRVLLLERGDFGGGTTAASTRIIHGGLRYLQTADVRLVRMDLRERETLLRIAPHLVKPLEFAVPFAPLAAARRLELRIGLALYDALAFGSSLPRHRSSAGEAAYYDARIDSPERLALENVLDAQAHGAHAFNYVEVTGARRDGARVTGVRIRDGWTGRDAAVSARIIVNATGPWLDLVARTLGERGPERLRTTKGIHAVCPPLTDRALVLFSRVDGRLLFAIPRAGQTWLGTTDTDYAGDPADAAATAEDVEYLLESVRGVWPSLTFDEVLYTRAGVRALARQGGRASRVSRRHRIVDGERAGTPGLVSIVGGKITGYRAIAEEATDVICQRLGVARRATTADEPLPGGRGTPLPATGILPHLRDLYGSRADLVARLAAERPDLARPLAPACPDIGAQVAVAARYECCATVADFIRRRSLLGSTPDQGWEAAQAVAAILGSELGWPGDRMTREVEAYARDIERTQSFRTAARGGTGPVGRSGA